MSAAASGGSRKHIVAVIHRSSSKLLASASAGDDDEGRGRVCAEFEPARYPFKWRKHTCARCGALRGDHHKARAKPKPEAEVGGSTAMIREEDLPPRKRLLLRFRRFQALAAASASAAAAAKARDDKEKEKALADAAAAAAKAREKKEKEALAAAEKGREKETEMGEELEEGETAWTPESVITSKGKRTPRKKGWTMSRRLD